VIDPAMPEKPMGIKGALIWAVMLGVCVLRWAEIISLSVDAIRS
jgi:hypothetical protein